MNAYRLIETTSLWGGDILNSVLIWALNTRDAMAIAQRICFYDNSTLRIEMPNGFLIDYKEPANKGNGNDNHTFN